MHYIRKQFVRWSRQSTEVFRVSKVLKEYLPIYLIRIINKLLCSIQHTPFVKNIFTLMCSDVLSIYIIYNFSCNIKKLISDFEMKIRDWFRPEKFSSFMYILFPELFQLITIVASGITDHRSTEQKLSCE